jgi:hypothetical protein
MLNLRLKGQSAVMWMVLSAGTALLAPSFVAPTAEAQLTALRVPVAPSNLRVTCDSTGLVQVMWNDNSSNETGFRIVRDVRRPNGSWTNSSTTTVGAGTTLFTERPAPGTYRYKIRAYNARGNSSYTPSVVVTVGSSGTGTPPPPPPPPPPPVAPPPPPPPTSSVPAAPSNIQGTPDGIGGITVSWTDNSDNETAFFLERNPGFDVPHMAMQANWTAWRDTPGAGTFQYRIRAHNSYGDSAFTPWVSVNSTVTNPTQPPPPPTAPPPPPPPQPSPTGTIPVLQAGSGFSSITPEPAVMGVPGAVGYTAKAIARWDVVPYQTITGNFNVGVVAFHIAGIDRVEFSLNGGAWAPVTGMVLNATTNVWEYTATINASTLPDGPFEVRARVIPKAGVSRVLQDSSGQDLGDKSLRLYANSGGTLPNMDRVMYVSPNGSDTVGNGSSSLPFWSIRRALTQISSMNSSGMVEGATVYLAPGIYTYPDMGSLDGAPNRWVTISGAPGTSRSQVLMTNGSSSPTQRKLRLRNLTLKQESNAYILTQRSDPYMNHFWIDGCDIEGLGFIGSTVSNAPAVNNSNSTPTFYTDVNIRNTAATGLNSNVILARNVHATNLGGDFSNMKRMMVNTSVTHLRFNEGVHPDVVQVNVEAIENMIVFNLKARDVACQGISLGNGSLPLKNVAVVNCLLDKLATDPQVQWISGGPAADHYLYWNVGWNNYYVQFSSDGITNFSMKNCVIPGKSNTSSMNFPGWVAENNHVTNGQYLFGAQCTAGNPMYQSPGTGNFHPAPGSPLLNRVTTVQVPIDLDGRVITATPAAIGPFQAP